MEDISNSEVFRTDFTTFRMDRSARGRGDFICVKNIIAPTEVWVDDDFEMIAVEVKGMDLKYTWEIIGIYRDTNADILTIERLAARNLHTRNITKRSIIGSDLNLSQAESKRDAEKSCGFQTTVDNLVWDNGYTHLVSGPTREDALLDIFLSRSEASLIPFNILPGISDYNGALLEVQWDEIFRESKVERIVLLYHQIYILGLQVVLRDEFNLRAGKGSWVQEIWENFKDIIFEAIKRYVTQKILSKNLDPEYYNKKVKRLKIKVRKINNKRKFWQPYQVEFKRLSKELLVPKKEAKESFLRSVSQSDCRCWTEFYKCVNL